MRLLSVWNGDAIKLTSSHPQLGHPFLPFYLHQIPQAAGIHRTCASVEAMLAGEQLDLVSIATPTATRQAAAAACIEVTDEEMEAINIARDHFHGEWNYTISLSNNHLEALIPTQTPSGKRGSNLAGDALRAEDQPLRCKCR